MIDIVIFAVVAIFILARLWAVLGERHDDEPESRNPFAANREKNETDNDFMLRPTAAAANDEPVAFAQPRIFSAILPPQSLAGGIDAIHQRDPSFDEKSFLQGAKGAFSMIVTSFAKGDITSIERFLAPTVLHGFQQAIAARTAASHQLETVIHDVRQADMVAARLDGDMAFVTVDFLSRQTNILRDIHNQILEGSPDQIEEVRDLWTFARNTHSTDPNWQLVETKS